MWTETVFFLPIGVLAEVIIPSEKVFSGKLIDDFTTAFKKSDEGNFGVFFCASFSFEACKLNSLGHGSAEC